MIVGCLDQAVVGRAGSLVVPPIIKWNTNQNSILMIHAIMIDVSDLLGSKSEKPSNLIAIYKTATSHARLMMVETFVKERQHRRCITL